MTISISLQVDFEFINLFSTVTKF